MEWLDPTERTRRFPQLSFGDADGLVEPEAGVLFARRAVQALAQRLARDGVKLERRRVDPSVEIRENSDDALIFACGAWLAKLFADLPADPILATRQEVFFFGTPAGDDSFDPTHLPAWVAFDEGIYGLPDLEHRGAKVAIDSHGPEVDPETMDRVVDERFDWRASARCCERESPRSPTHRCVESRVCQYREYERRSLPAGSPARPRPRVDRGRRVRPWLQTRSCGRPLYGRFDRRRHRRVDV